MADCKFSLQKITPEESLKAPGQEEKVQKWKEHFNILLENPPENNW